MRRSAVLLLCLLSIFCGSLIYRKAIWEYFTQEKISLETERQSQVEVEQLLKQRKPKEALTIIDKYQQQLLQGDDRWIDLFIQASTATQNSERILWLYEQFPKVAEKSEDIALTVADALIKNAKTSAYGDLREKWRGSEGKLDVWFVLDADQLLLEKNRSAAIAYLNSRSFEGYRDTPRLIRLALLSAQDNPRMSWEYLIEAGQKDPNNADIHSYRARLLEAIGKTSLALTEYLAATKLGEDNIVTRDQLAEFYRRHGDYKLALEVWEQTLKDPQSDFIWLKVWFWSRMAAGSYRFDHSALPEGELKPLIEYLFSLQPNQFWDQKKFDALPNSSSFLQSEQVTFWLRLAQNLKDGESDKAMELLQYNHFSSVSWSPELEMMLKRVLSYKKTGSFISLQREFSDRAASSRPPFEESLSLLASKELNGESIEVPQSLQLLLKSDEAFSAAFLAAGWLRAALELNKMDILPDAMPEWLAYGLAQALRYTKGAKEALEFSIQQKQTPAIELFIGELLISTDDPDAGLKKLLPLCTEQDDIGLRASWLVTLLYLERGQFDQAREMIASNTRLSQDLLGKEAFARAALLEGKTEEADKLYSALENQSWEAKSYLARRAYAEGNWQRARELTETLLKEFPNNNLLRENYKKIVEQMQKTPKISRTKLRPNPMTLVMGQGATCAMLAHSA